MATCAFFGFHYQDSALRTNVARNNGIDIGHYAIHPRRG